jgi:hypothetical protein
MTISSLASIDSGDEASTQKRVEYQYDVRLEVGVKPGGGTILIKSIFHDLVKRMRAAVDPDKPLAILTATDQLFIEKKEMTSDEFQKAFKVDEINGKTSKVLLGFKLRSMTTLYEIKQRLMKDYGILFRMICS